MQRFIRYRVQKVMTTLKTILRVVITKTFKIT